MNQKPAGIIDVIHCKNNHGIRFARESKYRLKFPSLTDLINVSMSNSCKNDRYQNWKWSFTIGILSHQLSKYKMVPSEHSSAYSLYAAWRMYNLASMTGLGHMWCFQKGVCSTWWSYMAWVSARVQPEASNHSPSTCTLNAAISICSPPNMITRSLLQTSLANSTESVWQSHRVVG